MSSNSSKPNKTLLNKLLSHYQNRQYVDAEKLALSITQQYPMHNFAWKILAAVFEQTKRVSEALTANQKALIIEPNDHEAHLCLGNNLGQLERPKDAEASYKKAIEIKSDYLQAYYNLAILLKKMRRFDESTSNFKKAITLKPDFVQAYNFLGLVLIEQEKFDDAIVNLQKAIQIKPNYSQAIFNLSIAQKELGKKKEAIENLKLAIILNPEYISAFNILGVTLSELGQYEEALENFQKAISIDPNYVNAYINLGNNLKVLARFEEASKYYQKAIDLDPENAQALNNFGRFLMLINNNFKKAFELMEWRLKLDEKNFIPLNTSKPRWDGLTKHKVFVWKEQGIGDHIMFSSMISELHASVEKVIVECDPRLLPLFQRSFPDDIQFITDRSEISEDDYDSHLPIGSLPLHFRQELNDFKKSSQGWLQADPARVQKIRQHISQNNQKKVIGLSWKTSSLLENSHLRKINLLTLLEPLKELDLIFVNLQYGDVSEEISNLKVNHGIDVLEIPDLDLFNDIDGLAALISACDSVISIDNFTAHFAGALMINTMLLLPKAADERWGVEPCNSYLYDSLIIHRQLISNSWAEPLKKMKTNIQNLCNK